MNYLLFLAVLTSANYANASTHFTSGNDLLCSIEVAGDTSAFGSDKIIAAFSPGEENSDFNFGLTYKGSLAAGFSRTVKLTNKNFKVSQGAWPDSIKLASIVNGLQIQATARFNDGTLTTTLQAGGQTKTSGPVVTHWDVAGTPYSVGLQTSVSLPLKTPFQENDKVWVTMNCYPGAQR